MTANILPLAFDIVPDSCREEVGKNLINTILNKNGGHVSCGVIGVNWLMRELTRMGRGRCGLSACVKHYLSQLRIHD